MSSFQQININLGKRSYKIYTGYDIWQYLPRFLPAQYSNSHSCIISDSNVFSLYGKQIQTYLCNFLDFAEPFVIPAGENSKNSLMLSACYDHFVSQNIDRKSLIIVLGGGVTSDLGGYAAATFMRGVAWLIIPTTILAQCDASIGGKTGINLPQGKNLVGAFHQPVMVCSDTKVLHTLPTQHAVNGMAEIIKMSLIGSHSLFAQLQQTGSAIYEDYSGSLLQAIHTCCKLKAQIVSSDEKEQGLRAILNLGHTIGHAIETLKNYKNILHGEAIAIGMCAAAFVSEQLQMISTPERMCIIDLIHTMGLPVNLEKELVDDVLDQLLKDKKHHSGKLTFIVPEKIGKSAVFNDFDIDLIRSGLGCISR
ncbi:3-dehydroquinate synthase [bacterium]|nr:3-dehydroquinate synthase [candidate division CSSED10-310 bacterium]